MTAAVTAPDKLAYSMANAAVVADVSVKTIQRAIRAGGLRAKTVPGRGRGGSGQIVRILHDDLKAWLDGLPDAPSN